MAKAIMKDEVTAAGIFKGNDFFREFFFFQQRSVFTRLNLAECEANRSLKDLVATISLIPCFHLTDQLDHHQESCFVSTALFTLSSLFYIKRPE